MDREDSSRYSYPGSRLPDTREERLTPRDKYIRSILFDLAIRLPRKGVGLSLRRATYLSRFAILSSGHMGMVPDASQIGDNVCVLLSCSTPMALRKNVPSIPEDCFSVDDSTDEFGRLNYRMIGPYYVRGVMNGERYADISELFIIV
jgi:hypothetical protein